MPCAKDVEEDQAIAGKESGLPNPPWDKDHPVVPPHEEYHCGTVE